MKDYDERVECAFMFKGIINPLALIYAQGALSSTLITSVIYKAGAYYVSIAANNMTVIKSYINRCANNGIVFEKLDIDNPSFAACYMYKESNDL